MPLAARNDADLDDLDGFVSSDHVPGDDNSTAGLGLAGAAPVSATANEADTADRTEAVLNGLPDMSFMLDRGRSWPAQRAPVATRS